MKIGLFNIALAVGKQNVKDARLDQLDKLVKSKKKTYVQAELVGQESCFEADVILSLAGSRADLVLHDLEFVETRLSRSENPTEKALLERLKGALEKEEFVYSMELTADDKKAMSSYSLLTNKPVVLIEQAELDDTNAVYAKALREGGYISFFTAGEKETRAWLIKKGTSAWEAAGAIHSDIQKGFIRAEIIGYEDYLVAGGENQAKQAGKQRLENKEYVMQDTDIVNFRFNK